VHRDVKPGNVLVGADGTVKITDFGIAWSAGSAPLTQTGQVIGTAHYLAPEQAAGEKAGPASDVYALGMIAYECLAGHRAFDGENSVQIALRHLREVPAPLPGDVPEPVRTLVDRALLKDPSARYPDGAAFRDAIGDVRAGRPLAPAPVAAGTRPFPAVGHQPRRSLRRRLVAPLAALVAGVGLGVGALQAWGDAPAGSVAQAVAGAEIVPSVVVDAAELVGSPMDAAEAELVGRGLGVQRAARETSGVTAGLVTEVGPVGTVTPGTVITLTYAVAPPAPPAGASSAAPVPSSAPVRAPAPVPVPVPVPAPVPVPVPAPAPAVAVEAPVVAVEAPDTGANDDHPTAGGENGAARRNGDGDAPGQGNGNGNGGPGGNGQGNGPGKGNGNGRGG
jgi:eukaryotic-like serine/threonine-protein kinase